MFLKDVNNVSSDFKFKNLKKTLLSDYGVDFSLYECLSSADLVRFMEELAEKQYQIVL